MAPRRGHRRRLGGLCRGGDTGRRRHSASTLFETAPVLGGRARRVLRAGLPLDNGQHLLLGAYEQTWRCWTSCTVKQAAREVLTRRPLTIVPLSPRKPDALTLIRGGAEGALGLLTGLLGARGLSWRERIANIAWMRKLKRTQFVRAAVRNCRADAGPAAAASGARACGNRCAWRRSTRRRPTASAQIFANVLKAAFAGRAGRLRLPAAGDRPVRPVSRSGGALRRGPRRSDPDLGAGARRAFHAQRHDGADAVRTCTKSAPRSSRSVRTRLTGAFAPEALSRLPALRTGLKSLTAARLRTDLHHLARVRRCAPAAHGDRAARRRARSVGRRPARHPGARDRRSRSSAAAATAGGHPERARPARSAGPRHAGRGHRRPAATPAARAGRVRVVPGHCRAARDLRMHAGTRAPWRGCGSSTGVYLAGDYVDAEYPATLEAAVRSGLAAARAVAERLRARRGVTYAYRRPLRVVTSARCRVDCAAGAAARAPTRGP